MYQATVSTGVVTVSVEGPDAMVCVGQAVRGVRQAERDRQETELLYYD